MTKKFQIATFAQEVVRVKLTKLNFDVQKTKNAFDAVAPNGDKYFVLVRGRRRTAGPTESQEGESVKIELKTKSGGHLLDDAPPNTYLGVVVIKAVSEQVEIIIAPLRDLLKINGYFESGRRDICYVRMNDEYLSKYANMPNRLVYDSEPLSNWRDLYGRCGVQESPAESKR
jgi:hypothetical protein